ncbi:hypothetical protein [Elizabethkingia anophelis]|uniref:hypothetical protein n=1 Tax=Elizabethkingia anophelis TaxID=1117645 RepID=UPI00136A6EE4|nr:hypothetical protein [Elizabethkingia anophelis]MYY43989.1 hypothetical protein [Elizabethkingia anophelis]
MKTYQLEDTKKIKHLEMTIGDLIPIFHKRCFSFMELTSFFNYARYAPDWKTPMEEEWHFLYKVEANKGIDFFKIKNTDLIVIPGMYIYPTALSEEIIRKMDHYYIL